MNGSAERTNSRLDSITKHETVPDFSVVIPFYNEESNVQPVLLELRQSLKSQPRSFEIVLVNDGSTDNTRACLEQAIATWPCARLLNLARNTGQANALLTGIRAAQGRDIVLLDGDGQNDPNDIGQALGLLDCYDMVIGHRVQRQDSLKRRLISQLGNSVRRLFVNDGASDAGCGLKVFHREVQEAFIPIQTLYSFMPALAKAAGFSIGEIPVTHRPRRSGIAKYNLRVFLWRPAIDLLGIWWFSRRRCPRVGLERTTVKQQRTSTNVSE